MGVHQWDIKIKSLSKHLYVCIVRHQSSDLLMAKRKVLMNSLPSQHTRVAAAAYGLVICPIKVAILLELLRIFSPRRSDITFWIYHILIWLNFGFFIIVSFLHIFPCQPIEKFWKPWIDGRCMDVATINIVTASFNSASNLSILILPQNVIWNLQMTFKKKLGVSAIFLAGVL